MMGGLEQVGRCGAVMFVTFGKVAGHQHGRSFQYKARNKGIVVCVLARTRFPFLRP